MSTLTRALGLTKGAIYGHFTNKDELAVEAFRYNTGKIIERIAGQVQGNEGALSSIRALAQSFLIFFDEIGKTGGCPLLNTAADSDDTHPLLLNEVRRVLTVWEENIVRLVNLGKTIVEVRPDADADAFAANFITLIEGGMLLAKTQEERKYMEFSVDAINLLIDSMLVDVP